ncbi:DUF294 nucleotidyltransferase-like domain-containing protein [Orrella marina]|uniref:Cyclic nucleotide-binding protein n=1 Tax=Orrella marina TaxID=2163011 RepID=A0A2R4XGE4_9BURK|nr:DUF294 nucleotidyltransferase-like domain-containing protein [Orrella marina]AWB32855.1 cyclic nucleotide-binding protein [Orrella marina]
MESEQLEILDFLQKHMPYSALPEDVLKDVARAVDVRYAKSGTAIFQFGEPLHHWFIVRSGAVEIYRRDGTLYNRLNEGGHFGESGLLQRRTVRYPATAIEDSLLYVIPDSLFLEIFENHEAFADLVEVKDSTRLRTVVSKSEQANELMSTQVATLLAKEPVCTQKETSLMQAASIMSEHGVSSLLITDAERMVGIVTDRDIRNRAVAKGLSYETPVAEIMTTDPVSVKADQLAFEAMLAMLHHNIHHLPVVKHGRPMGVLALSDILHYESRNSLFVVSRIFQQQTVDDLATLLPEVQSSFVRMVKQDASSHMVGSAMAAIGRAHKQRLLELAHQELGPAPVPYCFLAMGSMARQEQLIVTDQDNALILDNRFNPDQHDAYFESLARFVSDGLARCGYTYCSGGVMATNKKWRQPLHVWQQYFSDWIEKPSPQSLLDSNIFFDLEGVYGSNDLAETLRALIARKAKGNSRFLASMARNALLRTPPIGFFKEFVVEADGRHSRTINIKRRGTAPLTDLIRVHALAIGSRARNSFERIDDIEQAQILPRGRGQDLRDALEFISITRARHQAEEIANGQEADNSIEPDNLSDFDRKSLRDAFLILSNAQKYLKFRYQPNRAN